MIHISDLKVCPLVFYILFVFKFMCTSTYFDAVQSGDKNIVWGHSEIENSSLSDGLASEESIGLPAAPTIPSPSLARLKNFLVAKEWKVSSFHLHFPSMCFCAHTLDGACVLS